MTVLVPSSASFRVLKDVRGRRRKSAPSSENEGLWKLRVGGGIITREERGDFLHPHLIWKATTIVIVSGLVIGFCFTCLPPEKVQRKALRFLVILGCHFVQLFFFLLPKLMKGMCGSLAGCQICRYF